MKRIRLRRLILSFGVLGVLTAGATSLTPAVETVDFGVINETDGKKTVRFYVINDSAEAIGIQKVRPSCGCTGVDFRRTPVAPGDSAWIDLTYNPFRRPGTFEKNVKIYTDSDAEPLKVEIKGQVLASEETIGNMFPVDAGALHLSESTVMPARPLNTEPKILYIDVYNSGEREITPRLTTDSPTLESQSFPPTIPSGDRGLIGVYLYPAKESRTGALEYTIHLEEESGHLTPEVIPVDIKVLVTKE